MAGYEEHSRVAAEAERTRERIRELNRRPTRTAAERRAQADAIAAEKGAWLERVQDDLDAVRRRMP